MWSVCRQRTGCVCTSAGRISRTDCRYRHLRQRLQYHHRYQPRRLPHRFTPRLLPHSRHQLLPLASFADSRSCRIRRRCNRRPGTAAQIQQEADRRSLRIACDDSGGGLGIHRPQLHRRQSDAGLPTHQSAGRHLRRDQLAVHLRSTKYELRTHSSTDDSPLTRGCPACIRWGKTTNDSSASVTIKTDEQATTLAWYKGALPGKTFGMMTIPTTSTTRPTNMKMT